MSKNIIKLNEDYGIHCDEYNIILCERKVNDKKIARTMVLSITPISAITALQKPY